ncbi:biotin attachment protein [Tenacibaculum discolor]|uniref:Biotin attachment protein n=1 Tax=Tenacibaculum discolor TaxID=361581 RepID=A0A2G1BS59_9FLAO|nr:MULTISPECIES: biotin/lipoyl-binding protein [Tenacibaculum]MDP2540977.1 HlyD family efflux transporter periplasmic adaptor subunit [Tenacibaculum discolor]NVK07870.1 HlyD family efflux transporter periplasmic adaptor subunit [Tenacibaculum sp.]PHN96415.1 biotin attachment protein [Tenacibaculum discolor]PHO00803.1 biotin attachment protein [Rhodobacteraceae bacterium 4F10]
MLNISKNTVSDQIDITKFKSGKDIFTKEYHKLFKRFLLVFSVILVIILFLPWTQNVSSEGRVTTLKPNQRPQTLQSQIPGRIEEWFVQEGDFVKKGDTILRISEVKSGYFDTKLAERTGKQLNSKTLSAKAYNNKISALQNQIIAIKRERKLKLEQAKNKLKQAYLKAKSDSIDFEAIKIKQKIAQTQFDRTTTLEKEGLKAVKDVEEKRAKLQELSAKLISQENKFFTSKNNIINAQLAISSTQASYADKLSKTESSLYSAQSGAYDAEVQVSKLETSLANYSKRSSLLFITAPQNGYINKAIKSGIGETFKEGEQLVNIMPADYDLAVEMYIQPIDLPLIHIGEEVRVQFDGWPAMVFSGWPNVSYGTYSAKIVAIENFISSNGKYRVLIVPNNKQEPWPKAIRVGSGAKTIALLENVPIWFELWRQINSFPPNFYQPKNKESDKGSKKED